MVTAGIPLAVPRPLPDSAPAPSRVLVVEDEPTLRRAVVRALLRDGYDVLALGSVAGLDEADGPFDCAVLDVDLPDGDGFEAARQLRARGLARSLVFFTARADEATRNHARAFGVCVPKSAGTQHLLGIVGVMTSRPRQRGR